MTPNLASSPRRNRLVVVSSLLLVLAMLLAACGGSGNGNGNTTPTATTHATALRILSSPGQTNPDLFNPFFNTNQGGDYGAQGLLYEVLYYTNLYTGQASSWLANACTFSTDLTQLTCKLRTDVKWNDGQPFTNADVKFTFDLMKQNPALDQGSLWATILKSVDAPDNSSSVVFTLTHADSTALFRVAGSVFIVPQHIWSKISGDPAKFANDTNPVGTGPYLLKTWNPQLITYTANPSYWGTKPQVQTIQIPSIKDNTTAITDMINGQLDWSGIGWDPTSDTAFTGKDSQHNHTWFAASNTVMLYLNLRKAPFNNLLVRKAISAAIDRSQLPQGVAQYAVAANPTGVIIPNFNSWIASQYQNGSFDGQSKVDSYLTQAGFKKGSDGFYRDASGKQLSLSIDVVNGWSDWDQDVKFIVDDLNKAGIKASMNSESGYTPYYTAISTGAYDAAISWTNTGPTPYYAYLGLLLSANASPQVAVGTNFERWDATTSNGFASKTDQLLAQYQATTDPAAQMQAIQGIEDIVVNQLPIIPLTVNVYWDEYSTAHFTGWPAAANPYDSGAPYTMPDEENVILHLTPA